MKRTLLGILLVGCGLSLRAQEKPMWSIGIKPAYLLSHRADMKNLESHVLAGELSYDWRNTGDWTAYYRKPQSGVSLSYFWLGRPQSGHAIGLLPHMRFGLRALGNWSLQVRLGAGLGYLTKKYDALENRRNLAIGSHVNAFLQTSLLLHHSNANRGVDAGLCLSHFSNAAFDAPNLGYNIPSLFLRYAFYGRDPGTPGRAVREAAFVHSWRYMVGLAGGSKERSFSNPLRFFPYGATFRVLRTANPIRTWRMGLDLMTDKSYAFLNDNYVDLSKVAIKDQLELGLALGHDWRAGKLHFMLEGGLYLRKPYDFNKPTYQRMGFEYEMDGHWRVRSTLKFHRGVADYMEWGLNYRWDAD